MEFRVRETYSKVIELLMFYWISQLFFKVNQIGYTSDTSLIPTGTPPPIVTVLSLCPVGQGRDGVCNSSAQNLFYCTDGTQLNISQVCNFVNDCPHPPFDDELNCGACDFETGIYLFWFSKVFLFCLFWFYNIIF
jgi:hypothetical protein